MANAVDGKPNWSEIAKEVNKWNGHGKREGKQCRARWCDHLRPDIKKGGWTKEEEAMIHYYHDMFGPKWSAMSKLMKGRTDNAIKNKYNSMVRTAKNQHKKDPSKSLASFMKSTQKTKKYISAPKMQHQALQGAISSSSSSDSDNSAYSYQHGARFDQAQVLYSANSIPQYSFDSTTSDLQQAGIAPTVTDGDNAHKLPEYKPSPWDDLSFSF